MPDLIYCWASLVCFYFQWFYNCRISTWFFFYTFSLYRYSLFNVTLFSYLPSLIISFNYFNLIIMNTLNLKVLHLVTLTGNFCFLLFSTVWIIHSCFFSCLIHIFRNCTFKIIYCITLGTAASPTLLVKIISCLFGYQLAKFFQWCSLLSNHSVKPPQFSLEVTAWMYLQQFRNSVVSHSALGHTWKTVIIKIGFPGKESSPSQCLGIVLTSGLFLSLDSSFVVLLTN